MILRAALILSLVLLCESTFNEDFYKKLNAVKHKKGPLVILPDSEEEYDPSYEYPLPSVTKNSILADHMELHNDEMRKRSKATLVYADNEWDYNQTKLTANKLSHVSPTGVELALSATEDRSVPWRCYLDGQQHVDRDWIGSLLEINQELKIVPQISLKFWSKENLEKFLEDELFNKRCLIQVLQFLLRREFDWPVLDVFPYMNDKLPRRYMNESFKSYLTELETMPRVLHGAVLDVFPYVKNKLSKEHMNFLYEMVDVWYEGFQRNDLLLILKLGQAFEEITKADGTNATRIKITSENIRRLSNVDYLQIDIHRPRDKLTNFRFDLVRKIITDLSRAFNGNGKLILGIDIYLIIRYQDQGGLDHYYNNDHMKSTIENYLSILSQDNSIMEWRDDAKEHVIVNKRLRLRIVYPSLTSLETRLQLAEFLDAGIAISGYGLGRNYFSRLL